MIVPLIREGIGVLGTIAVLLAVVSGFVMLHPFLTLLVAVVAIWCLA